MSNTGATHGGRKQETDPERGNGILERIGYVCRRTGFPLGVGHSSLIVHYSWVESYLIRTSRKKCKGLPRSRPPSGATVVVIKREIMLKITEKREVTD